MKTMRKALSMVTILVLVVVMATAASAASPSATVIDLADGPIVIDEPGGYIITGEYTRSKLYEPAPITISTSDVVYVTLDNVQIDVRYEGEWGIQGGTAISISDGGDFGGNVGIILVGENKFIGGGIAARGEIWIYGDGTLDINLPQNYYDAIGRPEPHSQDIELNLYISECTITSNSGIVMSSLWIYNGATLKVQNIYAYGYTASGNVYIYDSDVTANGIWSEIAAGTGNCLYILNSYLNGVWYEWERIPISI